MIENPKSPKFRSADNVFSRRRWENGRSLAQIASKSWSYPSRKHGCRQLQSLNRSSNTLNRMTSLWRHFENHLLHNNYIKLAIFSHNEYFWSVISLCILLVNYYQGRRDDEVPDHFRGNLFRVNSWKLSFDRDTNHSYSNGLRIRSFGYSNTRKGVEKKSTMNR